MSQVLTNKTKDKGGYWYKSYCCSPWWFVHHWNWNGSKYSQRTRSRSISCSSIFGKSASYIEFNFVVLSRISEEIHVQKINSFILLEERNITKMCFKTYNGLEYVIINKTSMMIFPLCARKLTPNFQLYPPEWCNKTESFVFGKFLTVWKPRNL